jgi:hypothetical protein
MPTTGNVLIAFPYVSHENRVAVASMNKGSRLVRLIEVARGAPDEPVLDLSLYATGGEEVLGWRGYRAEREPTPWPARVPR